MKKALIMLVVVVGVASAVAAWYRLRPRRTPPGQPPLVSLNAQNLSEFENAFNGSSSSVRMVLLVSPT